MQMVGEGHRRPFLRVGLHLICNQFGQRIAEVVAWPRRVHPISETRREKVAVSADDVCRDAHLGDGLLRTELVRQADTGVQRNRLPGRGDPRFRSRSRLCGAVDVSNQVTGLGSASSSSATGSDRCEMSAPP